MLIVDKGNNRTAEQNKHNYQEDKNIGVDLLISVKRWENRWNAYNYDQYENEHERKQHTSPAQ